MEAELLRDYPDAEIELIGGHRGIFDVYHDDRLIFSKHREQRFPEDGEIAAALR